MDFITQLWSFHLQSGESQVVSELAVPVAIRGQIKYEGCFNLLRIYFYNFISSHILHQKMRREISRLPDNADQSVHVRLEGIILIEL